MINIRHQIATTTNCPPGLSFAKDIAPLFNVVDVAHMKQVIRGALDLGSYNDVKIYAAQVRGKVSAGDMPPPPADAWTPAMVNTFACWIQQGTNPLRDYLGKPTTIEPAGATPRARSSSRDRVRTTRRLVS